MTKYTKTPPSKAAAMGNPTSPISLNIVSYDISLVFINKSKRGTQKWQVLIEVMFQKEFYVPL
jgi:hypothetical protein